MLCHKTITFTFQIWISSLRIYFLLLIYIIYFYIFVSMTPETDWRARLGCVCYKTITFTFEIWISSVHIYFLLLIYDIYIFCFSKRLKLFVAMTPETDWRVGPGCATRRLHLRFESLCLHAPHFGFIFLYVQYVMCVNILAF